MTSSSSPTCPRCGNPLAPSSPAGLCPRCLLAMNLRTRTMPTGEQPSSSPPPAPAELEAKFPQFEILECLGRGGMGVVYKARQKALDRTVAIKILAGEFQDDPGFASRFEKEAKLLARLNHPNIVTIHDFGHAGGLFHIVMEYIDGVNVRDLLRDGRLEPEQALAIVPPICDALQFAHDHGVVHRDIKPENILLDREGRVKIADFGIATIAGEAADRSGTPDYMAPELSGHSSSSAADHRADIYSLGVVLYEMLTGRRPDKQIEVPSHRVHLDVKIDEIVLRALQGRPELRYQTAGEFKTVVATMASPASSSKTPPPPAPPPPAPATPPPTREPKPAPEPVPLAARMPEPAHPARERDQRLALILMLAAFFGTPLLMSMVRPSSEDTVFLLGVFCAIASLVFAIRARRSRTGRSVLVVWTTLIVGCALLFFLYFLPAKRAARVMSEVDLREKQLEADQTREGWLGLESRVTAARNATEPGTGPEDRAEACIRIGIGETRDLEINGITFSRNEFHASLERIVKEHWELPVRIVAASYRFSDDSLQMALQECHIAGLGKISFGYGPDGAVESTAPPLPITIGRDDSVRIDGTPVVENLRQTLDRIAGADPLRHVKITALSLDAKPSTASMRLVNRVVQVTRFCREAGFRHLSFTTEALVARAWQDPAQATDAGPGVTVHIGIDADGVASFDGRTVSLDDLSGELQKLKDRKLTPYIEVEPDPALSYAKVMPVLEVCRLAGVTNVTVVQPVREEEPPLPMAGTDPSVESVLPQADPIRITIAADESLKLGGEPVTTDQLRDKLVAITRESSVTRQVVVSSEAPVRADRIQEVMDACGQADLKRISLVKAEDRLREIDLNIALKSYEKLQTQLRDARLDRELLSASGTPTNDDLNKAEHLILTLQQQVDEARAAILKLQPEPELQTK